MRSRSRLVSASTAVVVTASIASSACAGARGRASASAAAPGAAPEGARDGAPSAEGAAPKAPKVEDERATFAAWLKERLPPGGAVVDAAGEPLGVTHTVKAGDTALTIAKAYLDLTDVYLAEDLAKEIGRARPSMAPGSTVVIPGLLRAPYKDPEHDRLGWPEDKALRAIYLGGKAATTTWLKTLDQLRERDMNAVVLDGKDYMGPVVYPSKVKWALETGATKNAPIVDLARTIRFAHARGIRVVMRISCFHDPWAAEKASRMSIQSKLGRPYPVGWLDPANREAQDYVVELAKEEIAAGADEIQLDYVRFPVQPGLGNAALTKTGHGERPTLIRDFVRRVHEVTKAKNVPLSLDVFGVIATGVKEDKENLGQDLELLGPECEVLCPMVYPSHYPVGFLGYEVPGNHPEIIAYGTRAAVKVLAAAHIEGTLVRPWLQAFGWRSPEYGPNYLVQETVEAGKGGGTGWLMWNPSSDYHDAWNGIRPKKKDDASKADASKTRDAPKPKPDASAASGGKPPATVAAK